MKILFMLCLVLITQISSANVYDGLNVAGGISALKEDAPFIVSFRDRYGDHYCAGSLIDKEWVLTAAHCLFESDPPESIYFGSLSYSKTRQTIVLDVDSVFIHPSFNYDTVNSDIALIKIKTFDEAIVADLSTSAITQLEENNMTVAGWGQLSDFGGTPRTLQKAEVQIVDQQICEQQLQDAQPSNTPYLDDTMFCAGDADGIKDACSGDSGGPIFYTNRFTGKNVLTGIVSWGFGCATKGLSGIYTDVSKFEIWINDVVSKN